MRYRIVHREGGREIEMAEHRQIDKVRNRVSAMLYASAERLGIAFDNADFREQITRNADLTRNSFSHGFIVLSIEGAAVRVDQEA